MRLLTSSAPCPPAPALSSPDASCRLCTGGDGKCRACLPGFGLVGKRCVPCSGPLMILSLRGECKCIDGFDWNDATGACELEELDEPQDSLDDDDDTDDDHLNNDG